MTTTKSHTDLPEGRNYQMPNDLLNKSFGELNIIKQGDKLNVVLTVLIDPSQSSSGENWQTGVAIDGSYSMMDMFGAGSGLEWTRNPTSAELEDFYSKGYASRIERDGRPLVEFTSSGLEAMEKLGLLSQIGSENKIQEIARDAIPYLADKLDEDGGTTVIYWACGAKGDEIEVAGDYTGDEAKKAEYTGPSSWGEGTYLMPAIRYFLERFSDAKMGFYVFITDGAIDDFTEVKDFTCKLSHDLHAGKRNKVKLVLIGVGSQIDRKQLEELDDLPHARDLPVDVWDHKIAEEMRDLMDIFAELVDENLILAPSGRVMDDMGGVAKDYSDGLPALIEFSLPLEAKSFSLEIAGGNVVTQMLYGG